MKTKLMILAALLGTLAIPVSAHAGVRIGLGLNFPICFGCPRPAYVAPAPVYVMPAPMYVVPAQQPVCVQPAPVYQAAPAAPPARTATQMPSTYPAPMTP
jgi:hypothetical protein